MKLGERAVEVRQEHEPRVARARVNGIDDRLKHRV